MSRWTSCKRSPLRPISASASSNAGGGDLETPLDRVRGRQHAQILGAYERGARGVDRGDGVAEERDSRRKVPLPNDGPSPVRHRDAEYVREAVLLGEAFRLARGDRRGEVVAVDQLQGARAAVGPREREGVCQTAREIDALAHAHRCLLEPAEEGERPPEPHRACDAGIVAAVHANVLPVRGGVVLGQCLLEVGARGLERPQMVQGHAVSIVRLHACGSAGVGVHGATQEQLAEFVRGGQLGADLPIRDEAAQHGQHPAARGQRVAERPRPRELLLRLRRPVAPCRHQEGRAREHEVELAFGAIG
jgi:hypothetical protein